MMGCHVQLTWRAFWALPCPGVEVRTLCRLPPLGAASAGRRSRCWRDKRLPHCWKRDLVSLLSRCWRRETSVGPGSQIKRCWGSRARWLPRCCNSCLRAGQTEAWNPGSGFQTRHFPAAVSPAPQCHRAESLSPPPPLLWCSSAGTVESLLEETHQTRFYASEANLNIRHLHVGTNESLKSSLCDVTKVTNSTIFVITHHTLPQTGGGSVTWKLWKACGKSNAASMLVGRKRPTI